MGITYSECVSVALGNQLAKCMRHITFSSAACPALHISHKRHDFRGEKLLNIKCVFSFSLQILSGTLLILRIIQRTITINLQMLCEVPLIIVRL
jgi:hypothetical protein